MFVGHPSFSHQNIIETRHETMPSVLVTQGNFHFYLLSNGGQHKLPNNVLMITFSFDV
jgi:hypothetical protein